MEKSIYIQRKRTRGFNLQAQSPDGRPVVSCTRPSIWGNPYPVTETEKGLFVVKGYWDEPSTFNNKQDAIKFSVDLFWGFIKQQDTLIELGHEPELLNTANIRHHLSGKHLSCWCKAGEPCHVQDVLLPIINNEPIKTY